jgi:hypothetical protein
MPPLDDLSQLLSNMQPYLVEGEFVFCSLTLADFDQFGNHAIATFRESEGISAILPKQIAEGEGLECNFVARMIGLGVYSDLDAVGFMGVIASRLAQAGISLNPVSAYYHDYLFVPAERAQEAMEVLEQLARDSA